MRMTIFSSGQINNNNSKLKHYKNTSAKSKLVEACNKVLDIPNVFFCILCIYIYNYVMYFTVAEIRTKDFLKSSSAWVVYCPRPW